MANEYDDLLQSFMNNSAKVYNEDKKNLDKETLSKPTAYSQEGASDKNVQRNARKRRKYIRKIKYKKLIIGRTSDGKKRA